MPKIRIRYSYTQDELVKLAGLVTESENKGKTGKAKKLAETLLTERQVDIAKYFQRKFRGWYFNTGVPNGINVSEEEKEVLDRIETICLML